MPPILEYIFLLRPKHADFLHTMTREEREAMHQHRIYADHLFKEGKIVFGGAATDGSIGVLVLRVNDEGDARRIFESDPAVAAGIGYAELHPFHTGMIDSGLTSQGG